MSDTDEQVMPIGFLNFLCELREKAQANSEKLDAMSEDDKKIFLKEIFDSSDVVLGVFPSVFPDGSDGHDVIVMKGDVDIINGIAEAREVIGSILWCRNRAEALAMGRDYVTKH